MSARPITANDFSTRATSIDSHLRVLLGALTNEVLFERELDRSHLAEALRTAMVRLDELASETEGTLRQHERKEAAE